MAAAIALAVILIIAVAGLSLAMQAQHPLQAPGRPRTPRMPSPRSAADTTRRPRRAAPKPPPPAPPPAVPDSPADVPAPAPDLLSSGVPAEARVVSVVDERVVGPVTRSRLTLRVEPEAGDAFEVNLRHAFPTPEARSRVKVGGAISIRYDRDKPRKVVIDPDQTRSGGRPEPDGGSGAAGPEGGAGTSGGTGPEPTGA